MNLPTFINKFIIGNKYLRHTSFWYWFRLTNHSNWRMDDHQRYWDFWHSLNHGWEHIEYVNEFEKFWGKGSYPPEKIILSQRDFDALVERLNEPPQYNENLAKLLTRKAPWDD